MPTTYAIPNGRTAFDTTLWAGNSTAGRVITNQYGFYPDFVWVKDRSQPNRNRLQNSLVGANKLLFSDSGDAEQTNEVNGYVSAISSSGFTVASGSGGYYGVNLTGDNYVGWQWNAGSGSNTTNTTGTITSTVSANATAGFSIVSYTGTGVAGTIGHGLSAAPNFIVVKNKTTGGTDWYVKHSSYSANDWYQQLNLDNGVNTSTSVWNNTAPTASVFSVGTSGATNNNGDAFVAYCWTQINGFSAFNKYTGNGSTDGPFIYTGFRPAFVMIKRTDSSAGRWDISDTARNPYNYVTQWLYANYNYAEDNAGELYDFLSNGFKLRNTGSGTNANGGSYIYMAWAENPFKYANAR